MLRTTLIAGALWLCSIAAWIAVVGLGEYGASPWLTGSLLLWLVSLGAPTTAAVLTVAWWWPGGSFLVFVGTAAGIALIAQLWGVWFVTRLTQRKRTGSP